MAPGLDGETGLTRPTGAAAQLPRRWADVESGDSNDSTLCGAADECTPFHVARDYTEASMHRTHRWALRSLREFINGDDGSQAVRVPASSLPAPCPRLAGWFGGAPPRCAVSRRAHPLPFGRWALLSRGQIKCTIQGKGCRKIGCTAYRRRVRWLTLGGVIGNAEVCVGVSLPAVVLARRVTCPRPPDPSCTALSRAVCSRI